MRLLLISENLRLTEALLHNLRATGMTVDTRTVGGAEANPPRAQDYDLAIVDVAVSDAGAIGRIPIAAGGTGLKVLMLVPPPTEGDLPDLGADDVLAKPFDFDELLARLRRLAACRARETPEIVRYGDLELDLAQRNTRLGGQSIPLTSREFSILEFFVRNPGRVLSRALIGRNAWDRHTRPTGNLVDAYISALRRKLRNGSGAALIQSIKGEGYRFGVCNS